MLILEVFSCSGGMAEGLRRAGLAPTMAFDSDADACDSYARNLGHRPVQMDARDLLRMVQAGWRPPGAIDLFVADPPCTPWSRAGKRLGQSDERDMLDVTVSLIRLLSPRFWLIANVPGLDDGPNLEVVQKTIGSLAPRYCIDFARLDSASYSVPQHRVRPFWFGHGIAFPCIRWPERTHGSPEECRNHVFDVDGISELRPYVTCRQALGHLPAEQLGTPVRLRWRDGSKSRNGKKARASHLDAPAGVVCSKPDRGDGSIVFDGPNHRPTKGDGRGAQGACVMALYDGHPISRVDEPANVVPSSQPGNGGAVLQWPWDRPSTTVTGDSEGRLAPPGHHGKSFLSDNRGKGPNAIKLSEKAAAILQGFPNGWVFCGATKRARWAQIGMAMPAPLAEAVARSIMKAMGTNGGAK